MTEKGFSQKEMNRIIASRLNRERDRLTRMYEKSLKRCMAAVHLTLYQEMCTLRRELDAETEDQLWPDSMNRKREQPTSCEVSEPAEGSREGGGKE